MSEAVGVEDLKKSYDAIKAVDGVSFEVYQGEIFGMVGPNGAGKTTTIECIEGLRQADAGTISVLGLDPREDGEQLREMIGVQLQESALHPRLKVWEVMDLFGSFYEHSTDWEALLERLGLSSKRNDKVAGLSGGQKQRLHIALALINSPELVFFDELTTGLDPQSRRVMWDLVRDIRTQGTTVFLTTHYMEEAERLCDRVAILDHGQMIALDTPENLVRELDAENRLVFRVDDDLDIDAIRSLPEVTRVDLVEDETIVYGRAERLVSSVVIELENQSVRFRDLRTEQPNLEDVFLSLTGRTIRA